MLAVIDFHMNERFDSIGYEEFKLIPYTNEAIHAPRQTNVRRLYLPSVEMKTQSQSCTGLLTYLWLPRASFIRQVFEFQEKI